MEFSRRIQGRRVLCKSTEICNSWVSEALGKKENNYKRGFGVFVSYGSSEIRGDDLMIAHRECRHSHTGVKLGKSEV